MMKPKSQRKASQNLSLIMRGREFQPLKCIKHVPHKARGIYALLDGNESKDVYRVVYIGMSAASIRSRLRGHLKTKVNLWTHFTFLEMWPNIPEKQIKEFEGILRHLYRKDAKAQQLNEARSFDKLRPIVHKQPLVRRMEGIHVFLETLKKKS